MRVALISNIHGNLPALEAVLKDIEDRGVDAIWNVGDLVGYGAYPDKVIRKLRQLNVISLAGYFDTRVLKFSKKRAKWRTKKRPEEFLAIYWALENLTEPSLNYLRDLPRQIDVQIGSTRIHLCHRNPVAKKVSINPRTTDKDLKELLSNTDSRIVVCGESHEPFMREIRNSFVISPGSVGCPNNGDPRACYSLIEIDPQLVILGSEREIDLSARHIRIEYDISRAVDEIRRRGLPEAFAQVLIQGHELATVLKHPEKWQVPDLEDQPWWESLFQGRSREEYEDERIKAVISMLRDGDYDQEHIEQATFLALRLFDELQPLHRLSPDERFWLKCGALLHDIGKGDKKHHLKALDKIQKSRQLPFSSRERNIIGSIARYHRRQNPQDNHDHLTDLPVVDQRVVTILSSLLRVADGLDASPRGNVIDLTCSYSTEEITIRCLVREQAEKQKKRALGKGELMEFAFDRELYIEWHRV